MKPVSFYRELVQRGVTSVSAVPLLLVDFKTGEGPARDFRTSTSASQSFVPPLAIAINDPDARVLSLEKAGRNPYGGFIFVGRASTNDIVLRDASISKSHAVFETTDGKAWIVRDNRSHNGTYVNRARLTDGERAPLTSGTLVVFGSYPVYFVEPEQLVRFLK